MIKKLTVTPKDKEELNRLKINPDYQINDHINYVDIVVEKPWGYEYLIFESNNVAVWILHINKGYQTSMHCHITKKSSLVVLAGEACCSTLTEKIKLKTGEGLLIPRGAFHSTEALSPEGIIIMEIETPNNKSELVRLYDRYGRESKGYKDDPQSRNANRIINSFHNTTERYDRTKRFGSCELTVVKCRDGEEIKNSFQSYNPNIATVLKGSIFNGQRQSIVGMGDLIKKEEFIKIDNPWASQEIALLFIKH